MGKVRRARRKPSRGQKPQSPPEASSPRTSASKVSNVEPTKRDKIKLRRLRLLSKMDGLRRRSLEEPKDPPVVDDAPKRRSIKPKKGTEKVRVRQKKFLQGVKQFKRLMEKKLIAKRVKSRKM